MSISSFAPGTGTARNRNCPAYRNPRRSVANPVGAPRCAEILSGADRLQRDAPQRSQGGDSIVAPAAFRIRSKAACFVNSELLDRGLPKMETGRSQEYRRYVNHRSAPSPLVMVQTLACNGNSKTDVRALERNRKPQRRCFYPKRAEDATNRALEFRARPTFAAGGSPDACC